MSRQENERGRQVSDAEYARLQAKVMTGAFSRAEYARLWAAAQARGIPAIDLQDRDADEGARAGTGGRTVTDQIDHPGRYRFPMLASDHSPRRG